MWGIFFGEVQYLPVDDCSAVICDFGALTRGSEHTSFYSTILNQSALDVRFLVDGIFLSALWICYPVALWSPLFLMRSELILLLGFLYVMSHFFLAAFKILSVAFNIFTMMYLCVDLFVCILLQIHGMCRSMFFIKVLNFLPTLSLIFLALLIFLHFLFSLIF